MSKRRSRPQTYEAIVRDRARAPGGKLGGRTVRVHIAMCGGCVDAVFTDADRPVEVVFTEDLKYSDNPDDCVRVAGARPRDFIWADHDAERISAAELKAVWDAAQERRRQA